MYFVLNIIFGCHSVLGTAVNVCLFGPEIESRTKAGLRGER